MKQIAGLVLRSSSSSSIAPPFVHCPRRWTPSGSSATATAAVPAIASPTAATPLSASVRAGAFLILVKFIAIRPACSGDDDVRGRRTGEGAGQPVAELV